MSLSCFIRPAGCQDYLASCGPDEKRSVSPNKSEVVVFQPNDPAADRNVKKLGSVQEIGGETLVQFGLPMVNPKE